MEQSSTQCYLRGFCAVLGQLRNPNCSTLAPDLLCAKVAIASNISDVNFVFIDKVIWGTCRKLKYVWPKIRKAYSLFGLVRKYWFYEKTSKSRNVLEFSWMVNKAKKVKIKDIWSNPQHNVIYAAFVRFLGNFGTSIAPHLLRTYFVHMLPLLQIYQVRLLI